MARTTSLAPLLAVLLIFLSFVPFLAFAAPHCELTPPKAAGLAVQTPPTTNNTVEVVATGWYAGWLGNVLPPSQVSWTKYSALTFAFA